MALEKQAVPINFAQGVDTKTDPFQVPAGKFLNLENTVFIKGGLLQKRNGYGQLSVLPNSDTSYLTTFNGDLTAVGSDLLAYASSSKTWKDQGALPSSNLSALALVRSNTNQTQADSVIAPNGFILTAYTDQNPSNLSQKVYKYVVADSVTGQNIVAPVELTNANATYGVPRVYLIARYWIIVYISHLAGSYQLQYVAVSVYNPSNATAPANLSTSITPTTGGAPAFDGDVYNGSLYVAWNGASATGTRMAYISSTLQVSSSVIIDNAHFAGQVAVAADQSTGHIWVLYYDTVGAKTTYATCRDAMMNAVLAPTLVIGAPSTSLVNITAAATDGILAFFYEVENAYTFGSLLPSNYIEVNAITEGGSLGTPTEFKRSVGLASKAFLYAGTVYVGAVYVSTYQTTYFVLNSNGSIVARFAYQNGRGYLNFGLPSVSLVDNAASFAYILTDLVQSVNKNTNVPSGSQTAGIYAQSGVNLITVSFGTELVVSAEIGKNLNLSGGITWAYDGYTLSEQGFFLYPDDVYAAVDATAGSMAHQQYFYQVTYEWSDNQGNLFRSAPSIPVGVNLTANTSIKISIPTLRLSYKSAKNPVKICIYRWSAAQQNYYQVTSITTPLLNDPSTDSVDYIDTLADSSILGNNLLYTTGGVLENIGPPAFDSIFLFDNRPWGIVSEDKNLLWFGKQVIEATPVEFSDLLTLYVAPTIGAQGSTGDLKCGAAMDDKAILFKSSAIYYFNGVGPDITGANNGYSQPTFLTSTVGCSNAKSIVLQPEGLMFEFASPSGNQIWILNRNLQSQYIGAPVEAYTQSAVVLSAVNVPGTNQVRFTLSSGITLMYDYYYQQWGTFTNVPAVSSVLYQGLHTYVNSFGQVFQETPGAYLDGADPVLMKFSTSWLQIAGLQGYQRLYYIYLLGTYLSPHYLNVQLAYNYNSAIVQQTLISPDNFSPNYGGDLTYGSGDPYGGPGNLEKWKLFATVTRCQSFQVNVSEIYNPAFGIAAGAGFTLSGLMSVIGAKRGFYPTPFTHQAGSP